MPSDDPVELEDAVERQRLELAALDRERSLMRAEVVRRAMSRSAARSPGMGLQLLRVFVVATAVAGLLMGIWALLG